ncbi:hypothetical protein Tco_0988350 [Tanacetum coccineum]|uniref:Uncharacterized protein n=1 Tax=Tanacetum coccineum TaxID=301880 RepID=A0ABQ5EQQ0_9ASTR
MFAHNSGTNVDNRGLKIPLNMDPLHGDSSSIEISLTQTADLLAHDQQHGTIDIPSQPIIVGPTSTLSGSCVSSIDLSTTSYMTLAVCSQQRQLYSHGLQQFPLNKGNIRLLLTPFQVLPQGYHYSRCSPAKKALNYAPTTQRYSKCSSPLIQTGIVDFVPGRAVVDAAQRKPRCKLGAIGVLACPESPAL